MVRKRTKTLLLGILAAPLFLIGFAYSQKDSQESLLIGPGDLLHLFVFDTPEMEQHVRVTDAGDLTLQLGVTVHVANLTPGQAAKSIQDALITGGFINNPKVSIVVEEFATQEVFLLGEVKQPGPHPIRTPLSVVDALTLAGGLTDLADRKILIERHGTKEQVPYFLSNDADIAYKTAIQVAPGDSVIVPRAGISFILGDVKTPGGYTMTNNDGKLSVLQLLARAGGTPPTAVPSRARLIRKKDGAYVEEPLPLSDMQKGKVADMMLQPDDIVYVPFSYLRNFALNSAQIVGQVSNAAIYRF